MYQKYNLSRFFITLLLAAIAHSALAGNDGGGGGQCKADFMAAYYKLLDEVARRPQLKDEFKFLESTLDRLNPKYGIQLEILDQPIQGCPLSKSPVACAKPSANILQLNCGRGGWGNQELLLKYKHIVHELAWWQEGLNDENYFHSTAVINRLQELNPILKNFVAPTDPLISLEQDWNDSLGKAFRFEKMSKPKFYGDHSGFNGEVYELSRHEKLTLREAKFKFMYFVKQADPLLPKEPMVTFQSDGLSVYCGDCYGKTPEHRNVTFYKPTLVEKVSGTEVHLRGRILFEMRQLDELGIVVASLPQDDGKCLSFTTLQPVEQMPNRNFCSLTIILKKN